MYPSSRRTCGLVKKKAKEAACTLVLPALFTGKLIGGLSRSKAYESRQDSDSRVDVSDMWRRDSSQPAFRTRHEIVIRGKMSFVLIHEDKTCLVV